MGPVNSRAFSFLLFYNDHAPAAKMERRAIIADPGRRYRKRAAFVFPAKITKIIVDHGNNPIFGCTAILQVGQSGGGAVITMHIPNPEHEILTFRIRMSRDVSIPDPLI